MRATIRTILIVGIIVFLATTLSSTAKEGSRVIGNGIVIATAYNSLPEQTDATPWITASGTRCREGVIAANFLPMGTKVKIEGFGNRIFIVEDRMNRRYKKRIDIWFRHYKDARKFGIRKVKYSIIDA